MKEKLKNIAQCLVFVGLIMHIFSYFFWSQITIVNLYYVSIYFLMMNCGLLFMLAENNFFMKYVSMAMFCFGGQFLYMEFAGNPQDWSNTNILTLLFIGVNSFLISYLVEKMKYGKVTTDS